jgi:hypothetical protein
MQRKALFFALMMGVAFTANVAVAQVRSAEASTIAPASAAKIEAILNRWQIVPSSQGTDVAAWRDMMSIQLKQVSPATLDKLNAMDAPIDAQIASQQYAGFVGVLGADIGQRLATQRNQTKAIAAASASSESGGHRTAMALGDVGVDQTFNPITPCRVVDTRNVGGAYGNFATRNWYYYTVLGGWNWFTSQGGVFGAASSACPGTFFTYSPSAAVATITVTGQGGPGNLIAWGGANPVASASTMSYPASGDTSSLATIPWGGRSGAGAGGNVLDFAVKVNAATSTQVVVDIVGYYTQPQATALDCVVVYDPTLVMVPAGSDVCANPPACPVGYSQTAALFDNSGFGGLVASQMNVAQGGLNICGRNTTGAGTPGYFPGAACCRVPGR